MNYLNSLQGAWLREYLGFGLLALMVLVIVGGILFSRYKARRSSQRHW